MRNLMTMRQSLDPEKGQRHYVASADLANVDGEELLVWTARDITDLRRAEDELRLSRDAAEIASHTKSEFLANMSHDPP